MHARRCSTPPGLRARARFPAVSPPSGRSQRYLRSSSSRLLRSARRAAMALRRSASMVGRAKKRELYRSALGGFSRPRKVAQFPERSMLQSDCHRRLGHKRRRVGRAEPCEARRRAWRQTRRACFVGPPLIYRPTHPGLLPGRGRSVVDARKDRGTGCDARQFPPPRRGATGSSLAITHPAND